MSCNKRKKVLVVGGTGYLGQHLLQSLSQVDSTPYGCDLSFTHYSSPAPHSLLQAIPNSLAFHVDLRTGHGLADITLSFGQPDVVVNCAAASVPRVCETNPNAAMSINVPTALVKWLSGFTESNILLIHLSTDQVYEGVKSFYKEEDETHPVNVYGKSKVAAEQFVSINCSNFVILRSSIIIGPQTLAPVPKSLPIQWIDGVLSRGEKMEFFHDEFRCPVYVKDVVAIILAVTNKWISEEKEMRLLLNVGGPERLSRAQMAEVVAESRGYNSGLIQSVSALSVCSHSLCFKKCLFSVSSLNAECTAANAFKHAGDHIVFGSGSPFKNVDLGNGKVGHVNQANNMYLFPGIGLGALLSGAHVISDGMLQAASECLASYMTDEEIQQGILFPSIDSIRDITAEVGAAVIQAAVAEDQAEGHGDVTAKELNHMSKEETIEYVRKNMWFPVYSPLVHEK